MICVKRRQPSDQQILVDMILPSLAACSIRQPTLQLGVLWLLCATYAQAYTPVLSDTHVLTNGPLSIELMDPSPGLRHDNGVRFSHMAWIIQANFRGVDYFYAPSNPTEPPWNNNPNRYPGGSPMEFDLGDFGVRPPGFDEATLGGQQDEFIKIGVGLLRRDVSGNYHQNNDYSFLGATTQATFETNRATFTQSLPRESDTGYSYQLETSLQLDRNQLHIDYHLTNDGSKAFQTAQYLHNFTSIGGSRPNAGSEIEVPWAFTAQGNLTNALRQEGDHKLVYLANVRSGRKPTIPIDQLTDEPYEMTITQTDLGEQYITTAILPESVPGASAVPLGISSWNDNQGIQFSPEQFVLILLDPNSSISWSRSYTFSVIPEPAALALVITAGLGATCQRPRRSRRDAPGFISTT